MVGAVSLYQGHDQAWLGRRLYPPMTDYLGSTWIEARESLGQIIWIGSIHDCSGLEIFQRYLGESEATNATVFGYFLN